MRIYGDYAIFTDPATKGGGEAFSYQIPTYQALKGIISSVYWKPTLQYFVDEVKIINPMTTETIGARPILMNGGNDLSYYTYLTNVEYYVKFHFEWNLNYPELEKDRNEIKHQQILLRSLERGGRRDIFLGRRECVGFVERLTKGEYESKETYYDDVEVMNMGIMFHSFTYPNEAYDEQEVDKLIANLTPIIMKNGIIAFERPEETRIQHEVNDYDFKEFSIDDIESVDQVYEKYGLREGED